ncbi:MAG: dihydroorotate dehydrogenase electron transfer subunit [Prevotella sp.]|nr:dihydroorotate dehydrogenase electron transfer subunit [Prevotella sp.]
MVELRKEVLNLRVVAVERLHERYVLLRLTREEPLPAMLPGQFVEVRIDGGQRTFLRRPISINFVNRDTNELWLLVATVGDGTRRMGSLQASDAVNVVGPLGHGFSMPEASGGSVLLVGGGVGVAPLLYQGACLRQQGVQPVFLLGARTAQDLLLLDEFRKYGEVFVTTEDGSAGERGFVTQHTVLQQRQFELIQTCGPTPMMKAVAGYAFKQGFSCEVSLENMMACGLGACLCCVEKTVEGNLCVCKDGPVFNINRLLWQS